ncbi:hypothetical protein P0Y43_07910 [Pseudomonas entomophila]|uniref:hypothetical protein n=1 Tax=Pseudomonas entomophila TaxID=312306 RepID=UPI0023D8498E|nr:hypothetical protein [Pseudomonas entomophila]MDF0730657.1 hypothetical protein [Pseudomonas entomophila]
MKLERVGFFLMAMLLVYSVLLFLGIGVLGHLVGSIVGYYKLGCWTFGWEEIYKSIIVGLSCGVPVALGIWMKSKVVEFKKKRGD